MPGRLNQLMPQAVPTQLTPVGEALFQRQAQSRMGDTQDYDLRGSWSQQGGGGLGNAHLTDLWKLPNHPTFSTGSRYSTAETPGGVWSQTPDGRWMFWPSQTNYDQFGRGRLEDYFSRVEPNSLLMPRIP